jgi:N-acetylated-alpha-linked acidic dipeptidase
MDTFGDPGWFHHQQIAQLWGLISLRLATPTIIPFNATAYTSKLEEYFASLQKLLDEMSSGKDHHYLALDPLKKAIKKLNRYAKRLDTAAAELRRNPMQRICYLKLFCRRRPRHGETEDVNEAYLKFERGFIGKGLPGRPVYKHVVYAPGSWEGYAGITFPSIREAMAEGRWKEAEQQVHEISKLIEKASSIKFNSRRCT